MQKGRKMKKADESRGITVKKDYRSLIEIILVFPIFIIWYLKDLDIYGFKNAHHLLFLGLITIFAVLTIGAKRSEMILFKDNKVYSYYGLSKNICDISSIVGIKIAITYISSSHRINPYVKNSDGSYAQTMFYLKEIKDGMELKENSYNFSNKFHRSILFSSVYDERVLKYLKIINPNIVIMECED